MHEAAEVDIPSNANIHEALGSTKNDNDYYFKGAYSDNAVPVNSSEGSRKGAIEPEPSIPSFISTLMSTGRNFRCLFVCISLYV
jgi:hypothetical protein